MLVQYWSRFFDRFRKNPVPLEGAPEESVIIVEPPPPINILVLGGSNSVMVPGYIGQMLDVLRNIHQLPIGLVTNLSVGGNTSLFGLLVLKSMPDLDQYDIVILEYSINDFVISGLPRFKSWQAAYEGVIRFLLKANPRIKILSVLFARKPREESIAREGRMHSDIAELGKFYDFSVANVGQILQELVSNGRELSGLYSDEAHYRRPFASGMIGYMVANYAVAALNAAERTAELPDPVGETPFDNTLRTDLLAIIPAEHRHFENSRFQADVAVLEAGQHYTVDIPGSAVIFRYLSASNSGRLIVEEEGEEPFAIETLHTLVETNAFPFLIRSFPLTWKSWETITPGQTRKVSFWVEPNASEPTSPARIERQYQMIPLVASDVPPQVFLMDILTY